MADIRYFRSPFPNRQRNLKRVHDSDEEERSAGDQAQQQTDTQSPANDAPADVPEQQYFPHAPLKPEQTLPTLSRSTLKNAKARHVAVLTTVLHKCMLDGDYVRAGRAFSILLRLEMRALKVDLRRDGLWGIGAEILLRRDVPGTSDTIITRNSWYSQEGFRAAREYYDRLILQYPYRKTHQHSVSSLHFNLAMYGVWIFQIQDRSQSALQDLESGSAPDDLLAALSIAPPEVVDSAQLDVYSLIKEWELRQARAVQDHIEHVTMTPPFDKDHQHLKFSGMIALWIFDLLKATSASTTSIEAEMKKASSQFRLCKENGGKVWQEAELACQPATADVDEE